MMVYILWLSDGTTKHIEEIFAHKIDAEKLMREFKELDAQDGRVYHYWIQEKEVQA